MSEFRTNRTGMANNIKQAALTFFFEFIYHHPWWSFIKGKYYNSLSGIQKLISLSSQVLKELWFSLTEWNSRSTFQKVPHSCLTYIKNSSQVQTLIRTVISSWIIDTSVQSNCQISSPRWENRTTIITIHHKIWLEGFSNSGLAHLYNDEKWVYWPKTQYQEIFANLQWTCPPYQAENAILS